MKRNILKYKIKQIIEDIKKQNEEHEKEHTETQSNEFNK